MVQGSELHVIAGGGIAAALKDIAAQFDNASGHKSVLRFGTAPELIKMATSGLPFDLGVVPRDVVQDKTARARFAASMFDAARVRIAVAVRAGARKPDIGTAAALKQALLEARAIASIPASATGAQLAGVYEQLGIAEAMRMKTKAQPTPAHIAQAVTSGEADLAIFGINVLMDPRLDIIGPLPAEIQREIVYVAGLAATTQDVDGAKAFLAYLASPAGAEVIRAKGLTPG